MGESLEDWLAARVEAAAEEWVAAAAKPTQEFSDELRELRQQLGMGVEEFGETYDIPTEEIRIAELARGVSPSTKWRLRVSMIKSDPKGVAELIANVRSKGGE